MTEYVDVYMQECASATHLVHTVRPAIPAVVSVHASPELEVCSVIDVSLTTGVCPRSLMATVDVCVGHLSNTRGWALDRMHTYIIRLFIYWKYTVNHKKVAEHL